MDYIDYFKALVSIPSPSKGEGKVASYIKSALSSFGYAYKSDEVGNMLFYKNTKTPKLIFSCHMDTVPPAVNAHMVENDDRFLTDGTTALGADDKAGLAVLLDLAEHYEGDDLAILCDVAEEIGLWGSNHLKKEFFSPIKVKGCYVIDAQGNVGAITKSAVGKTRLTINITGKSAHAGFCPENGVNAIKIGALICDNIECGKLNPFTTCNIGSFISNGSTNVVPDKATIQLEVRSNDTSLRNSIIAGIKETSERIANEKNGKASFIEEDLYSPYSISIGSKLVANARKAIENIGREPLLKDTTGGSDANNLNQIGIESVVLSTGYFNAHSTSEYIEKKELKALRSLVEELIRL